MNHEKEAEMPGGDRTGPAGEGPGTGRGAGYCSGYDVPGYDDPVPGGRVGRARGRRAAGQAPGRGRGTGGLRPGRGRRARNLATAYGGGGYAVDGKESGRGVDMLREELGRLAGRLADIEERLESAGGQDG
ncbi:MAG TPA: DUF5320 domain-containing protein [Candidatus Krumholzibacterium sp.]|nr:DUF5320 domain-containing protein [Candidatus Krumholzibacterium sp.]